MASRFTYKPCYYIFATGEASQNGSGTHGSHNGGPNTPHSTVNQPMHIMPVSGSAGGVPGPTTNLNIGMDYWAAAPPSAIPPMRGKVSSAPVTGGMVTAGSRDNVQSQIWIQVFFSSLYLNDNFYSPFPFGVFMNLSWLTY